MKMTDLRAVARIESESFADPWPLSTFVAELNLNRPAIYLVAADKETTRVIAYLGAWIIIEEIHITTIAVNGPDRRRGLATLLVAELLKKAFPLGGSVLTLEVRPSNDAAIKFYEKLGLQTLGRRVSYYRDEDALIMTAGKAEVYRLAKKLNRIINT